MKVGIISDIHGNVKALEAVLQELKSKDVEKIIVLGDLIGGAPMSEEVVQKIMDLKDNLIIVKGNREKNIIEGLPEYVHDEKFKITQEQKDAHKYLGNELSNKSKEFVKNLPREIECEIEGKKIYVSHYPLDKKGNFRKHIKKANVQENEEMFSGIDAGIYLYGHTHIENYNTKDGKIYINPGALGCPGKTNLAPYGILCIENDKVNYEQLYAKYNVQEVIDYMIKTQFPGYKATLRLFYGIRE